MWIQRTMDRLWVGLASQRLVLLTLLFLVILQSTALLLPQIPVSADDTAAFNRWIAELQPRLGEATRPLAAFGLLTIRSSLLIRLVLGCLALVTAANVDRLRTAKAEAEDGGASARLARVIISVGGVLLIGGWGAQMLWGWQDPEVIAWPGAQIILPDRGLAMAQPAGPVGLANGRFGLYVLARGERAGLEVNATDANGEQLPLLPSVQEAAQETLRLAFTTRDPEAFFAVPDAGLIMRLNQIGETIQIQAYRSASGDLLAETQLDWTDAGVVLEVNGMAASFELTRLPRYEVVYNPGAVGEIGGLLLLALGGFMLQSPQTTNERSLDEAEALDNEAE